MKFAQPVERWAYHDAAHVVGMTDGVMDGIRAILPDPERVTLIKNAVDLDAFHPASAAARSAARQQFGLGERFIVAHIGNMSLTYDFHVMLTAAALLPEITFLFVGGGSQAGWVEAQVQERHLDNVIFTGVLPHDAMPGVWAAADVCLIALGDHSVAGGTRPAKLYEALATGTPTVAAIWGEGAALLESAGAGVVVPIGDAEAMAAALRSLAADPERCAAFSAAARAYAEQHLAPQLVVDAYLDIFRQVMKANRRGDVAPCPYSSDQGVRAACRFSMTPGSPSRWISA